MDKSRDMGATWLILGVFFWFWLTEKDCQFLVGSRKEEYVDKTGNHKSLFWKLDYLYKYLPTWLQPEIERTHMHFLNHRNGSCINGEATNKDMGAGDRQMAVMLDELARVDHSIAQSMLDALSDTTDCVISNSTHTTMGHPYAKLRYSGRVPVLVLPWYKRPDRCQGLYRSPAEGMVEIHDLGYYQKTYPQIFKGISEKIAFNVQDVEIDAMTEGLEHALFIADGKGNWRSTWYDAQSRRRSSRDLAQNVDMNPVGSGDAVFDLPDLQLMRTTYVRDPDYVGEISYHIKEGKAEYENDSVVSAVFEPNSGRKRFKWWGPLIDGRPDQTHNYIVGNDISLGTGASNSVTSIFDVNTNSKVGSWVDAFTSPTHFAEQVIAICQWIGGLDTPFLIWESNGPGGIFGLRVYRLGYANVYYHRDEKKTFRPRSKDLGFHTSATSKELLIYGYREALSWAFRTDTEKQAYKNPDVDSITEAEDYIFYITGAIGPSSAEADEGGAKATHGDRVIADALCNVARADQKKAASKIPQIIPTTSVAARREDRYRQSLLSVEDRRWQN